MSRKRRNKEGARGKEGRREGTEGKQEEAFIDCFKIYFLCDLRHLPQPLQTFFSIFKIKK